MTHPCVTSYGLFVKLPKNYPEVFLVVEFTIHTWWNQLLAKDIERKKKKNFSEVLSLFHSSVQSV